MEKRSSVTTMFLGNNGHAVNDGKEISSKVTNTSKNAIRKACLTGKKKKKKEGKGTYWFLFRKHHRANHYKGKTECLLSTVWSLRCSVPSMIA